MFQISLRAARVNAAMKQKEAAKVANVGVATIINWEKGKTAPRVDQIRKLCEAYNVSMDHIFLPKMDT